MIAPPLAPAKDARKKGWPNPARLLLLPWWIVSLATGAKSFDDNPVIGSRRLNRMGLHAARARIAASMAAARRRRLEPLIDSIDAADFDRDGFIVKRDFLTPDAFEALRAQVLGYRAPAREMRQGDTLTRRFGLGRQALADLPAVRALFADRRWRGLTRYAWSFDAEPMFYIQTILPLSSPGEPDPQTALHADTFHATVKAWLFLTDVKADEGPFVYVPGSHRRTPERLQWEQARSIRASDLDRLSRRGSLRVGRVELAALGLSPPIALAVPANTLVVADTSGFHARGVSARPSARVEIWAYGRRNPFTPWTGWHLASVPFIANRRAQLMWATRDRLARWIGQCWRDVGMKRPGDLDLGA